MIVTYIMFGCYVDLIDIFKVIDDKFVNFHCCMPELNFEFV